MIHLDEVIVVEGKYDRIALQRVVDATVIETGGFGIFTDEAKLKTLRTLAEKCGLILLTDSDRSGMAIRNYLIGAIGPEKIKNVYIPDFFGTEKRKSRPSKEGKLGVEGMPEAVLCDALRFASASKRSSDPITQTDLYNAGLLGRTDSAEKRASYQKTLGLPAHLSPKKFLEVLNALRTREEFEQDSRKDAFLNF
jgi:ribonuclease M5